LLALERHKQEVGKEEKHLALKHQVPCA